MLQDVMPLFQPRMSLQLYQVDSKSYLLDFKSLVDDERKFYFVNFANFRKKIYY